MTYETPTQRETRKLREAERRARRAGDVQTADRLAVRLKRREIQK